MRPSGPERKEWMTLQRSWLTNPSLSGSIVVRWVLEFSEMVLSFRSLSQRKGNETGQRTSILEDF